jgi:predicted nucleic acid-binding protein
VRILVDTGVFSASISRRRRARFEPQLGLMSGHQVFLAAVTVAELRYGALVAGWGRATTPSAGAVDRGDDSRSGE